MSITITITIPAVERPAVPRRVNDLGRVGRGLQPLLGPVVLHAAEDLIPGLGLAVAVAGLLGVRITRS